MARSYGPAGRVRAVKALELAETTGPEGLAVVDKPDPEPSHFMSPGEGVVIDVKAAAVSFPDVLQTRGLYQFKPETPFVPGAEVAGVVAEASEGSDLSPGDRVAAMTMLGGMAEKVAAPATMTYPLHDSLDFAEGAALILNYHTVLFSLKLRGAAEGGRAGAGARRRRRRGHRRAAGGEGAGRLARDRRGVERREGGGRPPGRRRRRRALRRRVEGPGEGDLRRRRGRGARPRGRRPLHRQPALAARGRAAGGGRLHRRLDPRGEGEPPAAEQHLRGRRRLGRLRDVQARALARRSRRSSTA